MNAEQRIKLILDAPVEILAAVDKALTRQVVEQEHLSLRLFRMGDAARDTGLSRCTLWRAIREKRIRTVEVRRGSHRIPETELRRFVEGRP